jgi:hypothetical protein
MGAVIVSLGLAVLVDPMMWIVQVIVDVLLVVYLSLLFLVKRHGFLTSSGDDEFWSGRTPAQPVALARPRVPKRPERAPLRGASKPRRSVTG